MYNNFTNPFGSVISSGPGISFGDAIKLGESAGFGSSGASSAGGLGMDPLTLGLGVAGIGASLFGGSRAAQAQERAAEEQYKTAMLSANLARQAASDTAKANLAEGMAARTFQTWAPEIFQRQQREAAMFKAGPLAERMRAAEMGFARSKLGLEGSQESKKLRQEENKRRLKETFAERQAQMAGMFGRIAPQDVSTYFV
jgi:hypothetical protein